MWSKLSLKIKITLLTALALVLVTACITGISIYNSMRNFVFPIENMKDMPLPIGNDKTEIPIEGNPLPDDAAVVDELHIGESSDYMLYFIYKSQNTFTTESIIIAIIFVFIGTVCAYIVSGRTLQPMEILTKRVEEIDVNNLNAQITPTSGHDEVARLTHSFNNMLAKLNRSFEAQRFFAQNAAHELKTPLSAIRAHIEVLQLDKQPSATEYAEVIETIKASTERLITLVGDLLSLNNSINESNREIFGAKRMIDHILAELSLSISEKAIRVSVNGDCDLNGDRALLERAFFNLIHNAVRYNTKNGIIEISLASGCVSVMDSGVGIPKENMDFLFEPFYCVDTSRSKKLGGNGLGLSIAKNILELHGMKISVLSKKGHGTKFLVKW